ncbi:MAG: peptide chain release factor N(5)-glutamine methyltransferase [Acidimicrobiales bacterium]|nr:peptide chain release factor N(5)-glutamine methyltransferase [Acidimicrobiales bacterium]
MGEPPVPRRLDLDDDSDGPTVTWAELYREARSQLDTAGLDAADVDARRIVEEASGAEGASFHDVLAERATRLGVARFDRMVARRVAGEPLQYVLGRWAFRTLDLMVDRRVLIPRPETEVVAGVALAELARRSEPGRVLRATDLGTGSGAIGLSLVVERADTEVILVDIDTGALAVARANTAGLGRVGARVTIREGSWFDALDPAEHRRLDLVVSNPPYVAADEELPDDVRLWEPPHALVPGPTGLEAAQHILAEVGEWLSPGGAVVLELAPHQMERAAALAVAAGLTDVEVSRDLAGRERVLRARRR